MKKILLLLPNNAWATDEHQASWRIPPYGLALIASVIRSKYEVRILDANVDNISLKEFEESLKKYKPDVVGISVLFDPISKGGHEAARIAKKINHKTKVVMGGVYVTVNPESAIKDTNIDYLVIGEGEFLFKDLLDSFFDNKVMPSKGLWYRNNDGSLHKGSLNLIDNLDSIPLPSYDLIDSDKYFNTPYERKSVDAPSLLPFATIISSRGCPIGCSFCQVETISGKKFRGRSADEMIKEIRWLKESYGLKSFVFQDDNLLSNKKRAKQIFSKMIEKQLTMPWKMAATAVFRLDEELIELMAKSGCEYVCIAIESGSKRVVKNIVQKPIDYDYAKKMVKCLQKHGIYVTGNFIIGFPTETWDEVRETVNLAEELNLDYMKLFTLIPLRGTKIWKICEDTGYFKKDFSSENVSWNTAQVESKYFSSHDLTILRAYEWDRINFKTKEKQERTAKMMGITLEELNAIRRSTLSDVPKRICEAL